MRSLILSVVLLVFAGVGFADPVGYQFDITTTYLGGGCDSNGVCASPDTGFLTVANDGASTFVGNLILQNVGGATLLNQLTAITLAPGGSFVLASGPEGSNQGGFGPNGLQFSMSGNVSFGANTEAVGLSVFDGNIHSGSARTSPCDGISTDAFVLQGGSPSGCDNGDSFEESQASGHFQFLESATSVPEPSSVVLLGSLIGGLYLAVRRQRFIR